VLRKTFIEEKDAALLREYFEKYHGNLKVRKTLYSRKWKMK